MVPAVGIDLGTTNTVVGAVTNGVARTIVDRTGRRLLPSIVSFHPSGSVLVGAPAMERRLVDARNTIYSIKRLIGRAWASPEVQEARARLPFELREGVRGGTAVVTRSEVMQLPEISAFVLRQAKAVAEADLGDSVLRAVITVPASFNDLQRAATKNAGRLAGLEVLRVLNEPTAAALAYGPSGKARERVAVYDLGGGTFDFTLLDLTGTVIEVLSTAGHTTLGGDDIDALIADRMADDLLKAHRFDARVDPVALGRVRVLAESMKRELSAREEHTIAENDLVPARGGGSVAWRFRMTRPELEWASLALVDRTLAVCQQALEAAGTDRSAVERVILVGGATRMPMVARKVEQFFGRPPVVRINPDEVVALGAAIQASLLDRSRSRTATPLPQPRIDDASVIVSAPIDAPIGEVDVEVDDTDTGASTGESVLVGLPLIMVGGTDPSITAPVDPDEATADPGQSEDTEIFNPSSVPDLMDRPAAFLPAGGRKLVFDVPQPTLPAASRPLVFDVPTPTLPATSRSLVFDVPEEPPPAPSFSIELDDGPRIPPSARSSSSAARPPSAPRVQAAQRPPGARFVTAAGQTSTPTQAPPPGSRFAMAMALPHEEPALAPPRALVVPLPAPIAIPPAARAPLLIDVTPLSVSVETVGGYCDVLIDANTPVPCDRTRTFSTASDRQTTVCVRVAQGPSARFDENTFLGEVELSGLAPALRGEAPIAVTFEIDADGILNVRARDVNTGRETVVRLQLVGGETDARELEAMKARQAAHPLASLGSEA